MLWEAGMLRQLELYVSEKADKALSRWWGSYLISEGKPDSLARALEVYTQVRSLLRSPRLSARSAPRQCARAAKVAALVFVVWFPAG